MVISMFGSNPTDPADAQNWGHTVAVVRERGGTPRFLDVNYGQYSWPAFAQGGQVYLGVTKALKDNYGDWVIKDVFAFCVG
jgi:hypothetical protein